MTSPTRSSPGARFRAALAAERPLQIAGAINAYSALLAGRAGFRALYLSGAGVANASRGLPDLGMTTLEDVLTDVRRITAATELPLLVDADTAWEDPARTVHEMIAAGAAAIHIEDQVEAKRCGHRPQAARAGGMRWRHGSTQRCARSRDADFHNHGADGCARRSKDSTQRFARAPLHRSRRADDLRGGLLELAHFRGICECARRTGPGQHYRIRKDAALYGRAAHAARAWRWRFLSALRVSCDERGGGRNLSRASGTDGRSAPSSNRCKTRDELYESPQTTDRRAGVDHML
jgi:hypothetical protein